MIYLYSAHRAVIFAIAQLSCIICFYAQSHKVAGLKIYVKMTATTTGKCLRMRQHFPSAEPRTASEQEGRFSAVQCSVMTMVYLRQYCGLLPLWQPGKKTSFKVHDTFQPCCLLRANLAASLSVRLQWSSNETQENIRNSDVPSHRFSLWPRVLELFCVSVCHHF